MFLLMLKVTHSLRKIIKLLLLFVLLLVFRPEVTL